MTSEEPLPDHPATVSLSEAEQDELNNRILSGHADDSSFVGDVGIVRLGTYVLLELEGRQHVEMHADEQAARERYAELRAGYLDS
jgi:hypothetical protein